ncbi:MAG: amino acid ABC transporter permease [Atopobiaceae bacterium]|jgi:polar amino acid transport system substrate-binding protein|nr:amino acid ABC transporter permease [Atopobiaceae bacterium]MCH4120009.1 amino acid ABC transporter permease [Atopobiaceae bacterium]MCI1317954.1 amino acid ABC transporter permease [Atopobiaceae bacterium]MCI1389368.1 amino acid ABC transporter permease [Atopobiaceae bacterium]MCI1432431.1 amino acid ABC transporter permease [Atopobiaceae bacterium]
MARLLAAFAVALACVAGMGVAFAAPTEAFALSTNKATARPNEDGGDGVIGGIETRLTWEGTVGGDEEVSSVTLELADGGNFDGSTTRVTVLDGLTRIDIDSEVSTDGNLLKVKFADPIPANSLLRIVVEGMTFPAAGGEQVVSGSYETSGGESHALDDSNAIDTISNTPLQQAVAWLDANPAVQAWNSNRFLGMFLKPQLILTSLSSLFPGWVLCLGIVCAAYPFAILLGLAFSLMKLSRHKVVRAIAITYINLLRGTPLFLQIYIAFFGLPMVGINISNNLLGICVMAINSSAYLAEIFRAGIQSIPQGQYEAAASIGMSRMQTMFSIILPQTVRRVIPTVTSDFITSYKDTSLLSSVGVMELMMFAKNATSVSGNITPYVTAAIFYLIITLPLIKVVGIIERRIERSERGAGPRPVAGQDAGSATDELEAAGASHAEAIERTGLGAGTLEPAFAEEGGVADVR